MIRIIVLTTSFAALFCSAVVAFRTANERNFSGIDFIQFYCTGRHVVSGGDSRVFDNAVRSEILTSEWQKADAESGTSKFYRAVSFRHSRSWESYSSPFLYSAFGVSSTRDSHVIGTLHAESCESERYESAIQNYWAVCLASTIASFALFGHALRMPIWSMFAGAIFLLCFSPLRSDIRVGNVNQIQFGMLAVLVVIFSRNRHLGSVLIPSSNGKSAESNLFRPPVAENHFAVFLAGVWFGACLAFKPSLIWCGVMLIATTWSRKAIALALFATITGGVFAIAFSAIWFPVHSWLDWIAAVRALPDSIVQTDHGNMSPAYYLQHFTGFPRWLIRLSGPLIAFSLIWIFRKREANLTGPAHPSLILRPDAFGGKSSEDQEHDRYKRAEFITGLIAIGCQIHLLTSYLVWDHYMVLSFPALLLLLKGAITAASLSEKLFFGVMFVWCVMLLGIEPLDQLIQSSPSERVWRYAMANTGLLVAVFSLLRSSIVSILKVQ